METLLSVPLDGSEFCLPLVFFLWIDEKADELFPQVGPSSFCGEQPDRISRFVELEWKPFLLKVEKLSVFSNVGGKLHRPFKLGDPLLKVVDIGAEILTVDARRCFLNLRHCLRRLCLTALVIFVSGHDG